jgi:hypothetical protein
MNFQPAILVLAGTLALSVGIFSSSAQAGPKHCTTEECACDEALNRNTVEALEEFLRKYPQSVSDRKSACGALAVPPEEHPSTPGYEHEGSDGMTVQPDTGPSKG